MKDIGVWVSCTTTRRKIGRRFIVRTPWRTWMKTVGGTLCFDVALFILQSTLRDMFRIGEWCEHLLLFTPTLSQSSNIGIAQKL